MRSSIVSLIVFGVVLFGGACDARADASEPEPEPAPPPSKSAASPVVIAGAITFGLSYGPVLLIGAADTLIGCTIGLLFNACELNPLVVPVAGPFIYAAAPASEVSTPFRSIQDGRAALIADGIVQAASIALLTYGLATSGKRSPSRIGSLRPAPVLHASTTGIALAGEF